MTVWMEVSKDEYELPVAIADSVRELAAYRGISPSTIRASISAYKHGRMKHLKYHCIEIDDEEEE